LGLDAPGPAAPDPWWEGVLHYLSGRAALAAAFRGMGARVAWVPWFVCGAVRDALAFAGVEARGYPLAADRGVPDALAPGEGEVVLCVDYFGMSGRGCDSAIARFGAGRVVVDASQALLHAPRPGVATVYSPRKFCGVPDGGLLVHAPGAPGPWPADEAASAARSRALELRSAGQVQAGYERFLEGEASLSDCAPRGMSTLTRRLLGRVDVDALRARRLANHAHLAEALRRDGYEVLPLPPGEVPLCCPVVVADAARLRAALAARGIYAPAYWPDADVPADDTVGQLLRHGTLYLPCDQRYGADDMDRIARALREIEETA
jgi:hypothetical protein